MESKFKIGDVVTLNSGGPKMTVRSIEEEFDWDTEVDGQEPLVNAIIVGVIYHYAHGNAEDAFPHEEFDERLLTLANQ